MDTATLTALFATCAPLVHPTTLHALVRVESSGNPFAVSINYPNAHAIRSTALPTFRQPRSADEALRLTQILHSEGFTTSVGLAQVSTEHLKGFGLQLTDLLNPCTSLKLAQTILLDCLATTTGDDKGPPPLVPILSCFNSGNATTGIANGYAARVHNAAVKNSLQRTTQR